MPRGRGYVLRKARVAGNFDGAENPLLAAREGKQRPGPDPQREPGPLAARLKAAVLEARQGKRWQRQRHRLDGLARKGGQAFARPGFGVEQPVEQKAKGPGGGGLCAGQRTPQGICWMPAGGQPLEPLAGLTRFQTSSNPTGALCGVSRTMPEKRTLAQWLSCSVATSSRSALSDTTSVPWPSAGRASTSLRSSPKSSPVVNSRISSSLPASLASCSLTKLSFAARRKPAVSKPAGTVEVACSAPLDGVRWGNATRSLPVMPANCTFSGAGASRRRPKARKAMNATIASSATKRIVERPVPLSAQASNPPSASPPRMPPSMPHLLPCCAGAACCCCCAGLAGVAAGGAVTLRFLPTERPPPRRSASSSVTSTSTPWTTAHSIYNP